MNTYQTLQTAIASCYSREATERWQEIISETHPDWSDLSHEATVLGLAPLLYDTLRRTSEPGIAEDTLVDLRKSYYDTAGHNLIVLQELVTIIRSLNSQSIEAAVLKGAALILNIYERVAHRPMVDLDLLIAFDDLAATTTSLGELGYEVDEPLPFRDTSGLVWNERILLKRDGSGPSVEIHWHLLDNPYYATRLATDTLMSRSILTSAADVSAQILEPEDQIIHLCCHNLYHHQGNFARSLVDIAFMVAKYGDDLRWDDILSRSIESDTRMAVRLTLESAARDWYVPIPPLVLEEISSWPYTVRERFYTRSQGSAYLRALRTLSALPGLRTKLGFVRGQLFPDRSYLEWRYGLGSGTPLLVGYLKRYTSGIGVAGRAITGRNTPK